MKKTFYKHIIKLISFSCIGIFGQLLLVGLCYANTIDAQKAKDMHEVTIEVFYENASLVDVFADIESKTDFVFTFDHKDPFLKDLLSKSAGKTTVGDVLKDVSQASELVFQQINNNISVRKQAEEKGETPAIIIGTAINVSGRVTFQDDGGGFPGVNIIVKGTNIGTVTDVDGNYSINVPNEDGILVFSFIGFTTQEVAVNGRSSIDVALSEDARSMEEVVIVGYGEQKKVNLTGAIDVIKSEEITGRAVTNVSEALQGFSPNLNISQTGMSAEPGGKMNLNIRGVGSLTGDDSPYVLVDGVPMDLNSINPQDIESITVLKDAAASAIYGSRAPYGVILITTKRGTMNDEKVIVEYSNNFSFSRPLGLPHMANSLKFATAYNQASTNAGLSENFTDFNISRIKQYMAGEVTDETWLLPDNSDWAGNGIWSIAGNGNNDWLHIFYDDMVVRQKHDLSFRGGGKNSAYFISAGIWDQPGELRYGDQFYKRYNLTANLSTNVTEWLRLELNTKYINEENQYFNTTIGQDRATMYHNFARTNSFRPLYLPNGEFSQISNIPLLNGGKENEYGKSYVARLRAVIEPIKGWETAISYNYKNDLTRLTDNHATVLGSYPDGSSTAVAYPISSYATSLYNQDYQLFNVVSSYRKSLQNHNFEVMAGYEQELNQYSGLWGQKDNILASNVPSISTSTGQLFVDDEHTHWATQGVFSRLQYNYNEKYLAEINARYDGSSRFGKENRWGLFPSFSVGYNISSEKFWRSIEPYVENLKIRASWGSLGNQNVSNYLYIETLGIGTNLNWIMGDERPDYVLAPGLVSEDLTWETSTTRNIGVDASSLNGRLSASFDIFERNTTNMFGPAEALPVTLGASVSQKNNASLQTRGAELTINWRDRIGQDFEYSIRATLADNVSEVTKYNNPTKTRSTWYEGQRIGEIWGLTTDGIYQSEDEAAGGPDQTLFHPEWGAGDIRYQDINGDNKITRGSGTANDAGDYSIIGNSSPRYLYGILMGGSWKGFDLRIFWQGVGKRDYAFDRNDMMFYGFNRQQWWNITVMEQHIDYWRPSNETNLLGPNPDGYYPKPYLSVEDDKNKEIQTRYMQNAAYFRLKNVNLSYTIPSFLSQKVAINKATIILSGENLLTYTKLTKLFDPEALSSIGWGVGKIHPLRRVYSMGINITL